MSEKEFMRLAIRTAAAGIKKGQTPFGAVIVKAGKLISSAHNRVWQNTDSTAHAEINAIQAACRKLESIDLSGCTIYSTCEPCPMCFSACHWARIEKIVFGARISDAQAAGFNELKISGARLKKMGRSAVVMQGDFLRAESMELFALWKKQKNSAAY
jgi:tRNA(Arg) A34 adenosine deaminase TadA